MDANLEELCTRPIPNLSGYRDAKKGYRDWIIDSSDLAGKEGLIDIRTLGIAGKNYYSHTDNPPYLQAFPGSTEKLLVREQVATALQTVQEMLEASGIELFVYDAWRPAAIQHYMHSVWVPGHIRRQHPDWSDAEIAEEVNRYWANGPEQESDIDPLSPPPHSTGGAVDLTLRAKDGEALWMGTSFDDVSARSHTDSLEQEESGLATDREARENRRLLYWLMRDAGFVNNPTEWWHYSLGDQMWAKLQSHEEGTTLKARYSNILPNTVG